MKNSEIRLVEIKAPDVYTLDRDKTSIFLAGSIEMGSADNWQEYVKSKLAERNTNVILLNPRREGWDSSWEQRASNPHFLEQVTWELDALDAVEVIVMYFDPNTKSPVSLLELGLYADSGKLIVCCPDGFWRKGNVEVVCKRKGIPLVETLDKLIEVMI